MFCVKCGKELNNEYRCCMSCEALNPFHPDNKKTMEFLQNNTTYQQSKTEISSNINTIDNLNVKSNNILDSILFIGLNCIGFILLLTMISLSTNEIGYSLILSFIIYFLLSVTNYC